MTADIIWVRRPADGDTPAGEPQRCLADSLRYATSIGYEQCDAPVETIVASVNSQTHQASDPVVTSNSIGAAKPWRSRRG